MNDESRLNQSMVKLLRNDSNDKVVKCFNWSHPSKFLHIFADSTLFVNVGNKFFKITSHKGSVVATDEFMLETNQENADTKEFL